MTRTPKKRVVDTQNQAKLVIARFSGSTKQKTRFRQKVRNLDLKEAQTAKTLKNREVDSQNRSKLVVARFHRLDKTNSLV